MKYVPDWRDAWPTAPVPARRLWLGCPRDLPVAETAARPVSDSTADACELQLYGQEPSGRQRSYDLAMIRSNRLAVFLLCRARGIRPRGPMRKG